MKAKSTFPARNAQASPLWRNADAICQGFVLQLMPACSKLGLNSPVIRWMSAYAYFIFMLGSGVWLIDESDKVVSLGTDDKALQTPRSKVEDYDRR